MILMKKSSFISGLYAYLSVDDDDLYMKHREVVVECNARLNVRKASELSDIEIPTYIRVMRDLDPTADTYFR